MLRYAPGMRVANIGDVEGQMRLEASVSGLAKKVPIISAERLFPQSQRAFFWALLAALVLGFVISWAATAVAVCAILTLSYVAAVSYRIYIFVRSTKPDGLERVTDDEARAVPDDELPIYTILIPAYHEANVIGGLVERLNRLEYPPDLLDVKILLEADDTETIAALHEADPGPQFELVLIPPAEPRTKPKALNFGLTLARGEFVAVYDAEDEPDPLQLRKAVATFSRVGPEVGCLQAKLAYSNPYQNIITRWFALEYALWFEFFLPGLASLQAPIPLGGTSNHFRRAQLEEMGAWDPFNVTEDADLGLRMFREGMRVHILDSVTFEEANSDFVNWTRQRSRWYKGYIQTFFVHLREPEAIEADMGWKNLAQFCTFVGGTPLLAVLNPVFWVLTAIWFTFEPHEMLQIFPAPVYYVGMLCWALGNFLMVYIAIVACRIIDRPRLLAAAVLYPAYWVMMSAAAMKALLQIVVTPSLWEKTMHGLQKTPTPISPEVGVR